MYDLSAFIDSTGETIRTNQEFIHPKIFWPISGEFTLCIYERLWYYIFKPFPRNLPIEYISLNIKYNIIHKVINKSNAFSKVILKWWLWMK